MAKRRDLQLAFLAALVAVSPGCAGKPILPWSRQSNQPASLDDLAAKNAAANKPSWTERFAMKPKVIPAQDPTTLGGKAAKPSADVFIGAARIHEGRGNFDDAKIQYHKALEADKNNITALVSLARLHDRQQQFADAEKLYRQAAQFDPKSALVWNDLGLCYARQQRLDEAARNIEHAIKLQPTNKMYRNNLATVLVEAGRIEEAWSHLAAANEPAVAHYNMGYLLHKRQYTAQAVEHLELALAANPSLKEAQKLLSVAQGRSGTTEELVVQGPSSAATEAPSYSISDTTSGSLDPQAVEEQVIVADSGPQSLVNPLAPSTRRSATYRMPPTEEQADDPAPQPARLPEIAEQGQEADSQVELTQPGEYPSRRISYEEDGIRQPTNVIKLLGGEPLTAPLPSDD